MKYAIARREYMQTHPGNFISSQEIRITTELEKRGMIKGKDFIPQYYMGELMYPYLVDIYIPKYDLVIESEADYWHDKPGRREIDSIRTAEIIANGGKMYRVLYSRVDKEFDTVIKEIYDLMEDKNG